MNDKHKKKGLLSTGIALLTTAIPLAVRGKPVEGGIIAVIAIAFILAYDYLDDKMKSPPSLPEGVDEEAVEQVAETLAEKANNSSYTDGVSGE